MRRRPIRRGAGGVPVGSDPLPRRRPGSPGCAATDTLRAGVRCTFESAKNTFNGIRRVVGVSESFTTVRGKLKASVAATRRFGTAREVDSGLSGMLNTVGGLPRWRSVGRHPRKVVSAAAPERHGVPPRAGDSCVFRRRGALAGSRGVAFTASRWRTRLRRELMTARYSGFRGNSTPATWRVCRLTRAGAVGGVDQAGDHNRAPFTTTPFPASSTCHNWTTRWESRWAQFFQVQALGRAPRSGSNDENARRREWHG